MPIFNQLRNDNYEYHNIPKAEEEFCTNGKVNE